MKLITESKDFTILDNRFGICSFLQRVYVLSTECFTIFYILMITLECMHILLIFIIFGYFFLHCNLR